MIFSDITQFQLRDIRSSDAFRPIAACKPKCSMDLEPQYNVNSLMRGDKFLSCKVTIEFFEERKEFFYHFSSSQLCSQFVKIPLQHAHLNRVRVHGLLVTHMLGTRLDVVRAKRKRTLKKR